MRQKAVIFAKQQCRPVPAGRPPQILPVKPVNHRRLSAVTHNALRTLHETYLALNMQTPRAHNLPSRSRKKSGRSKVTVRSSRTIISPCGVHTKMRQIRDLPVFAVAGSSVRSQSAPKRLLLPLIRARRPSIISKRPAART